MPHAKTCTREVWFCTTHCIPMPSSLDGKQSRPGPSATARVSAQGQQCDVTVCTPAPKTRPWSDTWHALPHFTLKAPKPGLQSQNREQERSHRFPAGCPSKGLEAKGMQLSSTHQDVCWRAGLCWTITESQS